MISQSLLQVGLKRYAKPCKILSFLLYCVIVGLGFIMTVLGIAPFSIYVLGILIIAVVVSGELIGQSRDRNYDF